ncbi:hypothetical protein KY312_00440 [Candidatus Woesearchaeota archaeon]|nr:hypothetical protein [Candidatus Woesearchaeota archaeon]
MNTKSNLRYLIPSAVIVVLLNLYLAKVGYEMTGFAIGEICNSPSLLSKTPDSVTLHNGANVQNKTRYRDEEHAFQQVLVSPKFIYMNWTNDISDNSTIDSAILTLEHEDFEVLSFVQLWNGTGWENVCDLEYSPEKK